MIELNWQISSIPFLRLSIDHYTLAQSSFDLVGRAEGAERNILTPPLSRFLGLESVGGLRNTYRKQIKLDLTTLR